MVAIEREPKVCAITASFTFIECINYADLEAKVCEAFDAYDESGVFVYPKILTKIKSQLHIPLPFEVDTRQVFYRCRYENYQSRNGELRANFLNQTCFYYTTNTNKKRCFKFFRNGKLHVTGFNDIEDMDTKVLEFNTKLAEYIGKPLVSAVATRTIHMLNMTLKVKKTFKLEVLCMYFQKPKFNLHVYLSLENYCGLMLNTEEYKLILFRSGSVIITGTKSVEKAMEGYARLMQLLESAEKESVLG